jgi:hypothetical protein
LGKRISFNQGEAGTFSPFASSNFILSFLGEAVTFLIVRTGNLFALCPRRPCRVRSGKGTPTAELEIPYLPADFGVQEGVSAFVEHQNE